MNITFNSLAFLSPSSVETYWWWIPSMIICTVLSSVHKFTCLLSERSVLFPTSIIMTSLPRSVRTSSIHFDVWWNEFASRNLISKYQNYSLNSYNYKFKKKFGILVISYTTTATVESRIYEGIRLRNLSCPAVSHNCSLTLKQRLRWICITMLKRIW